MRYILTVLLLLSLSVPVYGNTLSGDTNGRAAGQTSVTARIELPEEENPEEDKTEDEENAVRTGDETGIYLYAGMILISGALLIQRLNTGRRTE